MSYKQLQESFPDHLIEAAIKVARACAMDDDEKHNCIPENVEDFQVHSWVVAAICVSIGESYKSGYADCFSRYGGGGIK